MAWVVLPVFLPFLLVVLVLLAWLWCAVLAAQLASRLRASWEGDPGSAV
jgi:hypothetical protein